MGWGHRTTLKESIYWEGGTPHILCWGGDTAQHLQEKLSCGWVGGPNQEIIPLRGSILQAETCQILSLAENPRWSPSVAKIYMVRWVDGVFLQEILPLRGSILQAETCQILSLAKNPRWSRVWQYRKTCYSETQGTALFHTQNHQILTDILAEQILKYHQRDYRDSHHRTWDQRNKLVDRTAFLDLTECFHDFQ